MWQPSSSRHTKLPGHVVCMTSHGRGRLRWAFLGSVAEQIISESHDPVVLLGRQCGTEWPDGLKHMLIGIDGSSDDSFGLADRDRLGSGSSIWTSISRWRSIPWTPPA